MGGIEDFHKFPQSRLGIDVDTQLCILTSFWLMKGYIASFSRRLVSCLTRGPSASQTTPSSTGHGSS